MDLKITPEVVAGFHDKDSKIPRFRTLYEQHEFIRAYSKHTDLRMADDPKWAIGRGDEWESHGALQLKFLIEEGMRPEHCLLDVGCGPGRAARRFVPYLADHHYVGVDISEACIAHARELAVQEGWADRKPLFLLDPQGELDLIPKLPSIGDLKACFDFIFAHSVFTHLPPELIRTIISNAAKLLDRGGKFLFSYKQSEKPQRSGLKQYQYPHRFFKEAADAAGLKCEGHPMMWPAHQCTIRLTKTA